MASPSNAPVASTPAIARPSVSRGSIAAAAGAAALIGILIWIFSSRAPAPPEPAVAAVAPSPVSLDLSGRWRAQLSKMIGGATPRPVLKEVAIESDRDGRIRAARVVLTDPGRGGAGAGYRMAPDGPRRLQDALAAVASQPRGAPLTMEFLELPAWVPARERLWRAIEGVGVPSAPSRYVLVESLEKDYLIQAGLNESGFLSYAFFSPDYAPDRGRDELSRVIHPEADASLRGFRNVLWDLSGAADFLKLEVPATISGPESGDPDRLVLKR